MAFDKQPEDVSFSPERIVSAIYGVLRSLAWGVSNAAALTCLPTRDATCAVILSFLARNGIVTTFRPNASSLRLCCKSTVRTSSGCTPTKRATSYRKDEEYFVVSFAGHVETATGSAVM